jgi:hypothetical protein
VRRIAEKQRFAADVPRKAFDRSEISRRIREKIFQKRRHQRNGVGEIRLKKIEDGFFVD